MDSDDSLAGLLDRTHGALIAGNFTALPALVAATGALLDAGLPAEAGSLAALRSGAVRNAAAIEAALAGVRAVRARLAEIEGQRHSIGYDGQGRRRNLSPRGDLARRV